MLQHQFAVGQGVCWKDADDTWQYGEVVESADDALRVENSHCGTNRRVDPTNGVRATAPQTRFKTSPVPRDGDSRLFLTALDEALDRVGVDDDSVAIIWDDDDPVVVFAPDVDEGRLNSLRHAVAELTPDHLSPKVRDCDCLRP